MTIDIKSIFIDTFTKMFGSNLWLIAIISAVVMVVFIFRHSIAYNLDLTKREKNKLTEKALLILIFIGVATIAYLYVKEYYFLLSLTISFILTYFLYQIGFLDMVIEKWEDKNGRW